MLYKSIMVNKSIEIVENICEKFDITFKEYYKDILSILIPSLIFQDGSVLITSFTINKINRLIREKNSKFNFVNILLALNIITEIDMYGTITIPLAMLMNKFVIRKETISKYGTDEVCKKVLINATESLIVAEVLSYIGIPKIISVGIANVILGYATNNIKEENDLFKSANIGFKGYGMSKVKDVLIKMEIDRILLSSMILIVICGVGLNISKSLILVNIISELIVVIKTEIKIKKCKGFLN